MSGSDNNSVEKKHSRVLHCPDCNSTNIYIPAGGYTGNYYHCKDCGYEGALVIEYDDEDFAGEKPADNDRQKIPGDSRSLTAGFIVLLILVALFLMIVILGIAGVF
ncbi:TFIIB-type zinc ribbon-containing protein [Methanoplanus endosymbiosus]|uniref:TFIIB-type zinc ribbon-containing protein n=1 Tax=Methanoplanus endosymbiosus TaxID=33865 RepID=A0A9E7PNE5_9EURY|nr:TFIIB-type zinc ribbon-containing protein [Methanoplanus endosymbiosus]UUX93070.1 TFIIB-type zinc ribbon-containing protein [Methanoplanus endosymbiosus]